MGFNSIESDPCIYVRGSNMIVLCVDECIILSKPKKEVDKLFKEIDYKGYKITDKGTMEEYLEVRIPHYNDNTYRIF